MRGGGLGYTLQIHGYTEAMLGAYKAAGHGHTVSPSGAHVCGGRSGSGTGCGRTS
jgi:hypothetical protein